MWQKRDTKSHHWGPHFQFKNLSPCLPHLLSPSSFLKVKTLRWLPYPKKKKKKELCKGSFRVKSGQGLILGGQLLLILHREMCTENGLERAPRRWAAWFWILGLPLSIYVASDELPTSVSPSAAQVKDSRESELRTGLSLLGEWQLRLPQQWAPVRTCKCWVHSDSKAKEPPAMQTEGLETQLFSPSGVWHLVVGFEAVLLERLT